jgi:outer membrane immunogenic protein
MKHLFFKSVALLALAAASPVVAADIPARGPIAKAPVMVAAAPSWAGFYIGINGGFAWSRHRFGDPTEFDVTGAIFRYNDFGFDGDGWLVGYQSGYNWQSGNWVYGYESDTQFADIKGDTRFANAIFNVPSGVFHTDVESKLRSFGTVRLRLGHTVTPSSMVYATGGFAYGRIKSTLSFPPSAGGPVVFTDEDRRYHFGFAAGAGFESKLTQNLSWKAEYLYVDLGRKTHDFLIAGDTYTWRERVQMHVVRAGLNYQFDWGALFGKGPVVTRY